MVCLQILWFLKKIADSCPLRSLNQGQSPLLTILLTHNPLRTAHMAAAATKSRSRTLERRLTTNRMQSLHLRGLCDQVQ